MKKILVLTLFLCVFQLKAQFQLPTGLSFKIEIDSIDENKVFVKQFKVLNLADTTLSFMRITAKVNGKFNANADSSQFNFNVTFEGQLDSAKGIKNLERRLAKEKEEEIRQEEARLLRLYQKNKDVDPKLREKANAAKVGIISDVPKSYSLASPNPNQVLIIDKNKKEQDSKTISPIKKRKWWRRKK